MKPLLVLKCGGAVASQAVEPVLALRAEGYAVLVVHGAGPQISAEMERRELPVEFVGGRRVTTPEALDVVRESLAKVNAALCAAIGPLAAGFMGDEIGLTATRIDKLGLVGDPTPCRPAPILDALGQGRIPVVAPLAKGPLNVNADEAAAALAVGLGAERLLFVTDVPGVLVEGDVLPSIGVDEADTLLGNGTFEGGIVPKLRAAVRATRLGVQADIGETAVLSAENAARFPRGGSRGLSGNPRDAGARENRALARMQGAPIFRNIGATEDAASARFAAASGAEGLSGQAPSPVASLGTDTRGS